MIQRKMRVLCLHGWRTSGKIMTMQTAAMQYHTPIEYFFITAPHPAEGPPDEGIGTYYAKYPYYEWYLESTSTAEHFSGLDESIDLVLSILAEEGPFDGIMGFSQGAAMVTRLAHLQDCKDERFNGMQLFKFAILIGGVPPPELKDRTIKIPSLHIHGLADQWLEKSRQLAKLYDPTSLCVLEHNEGHNIPSMRTGLYPKISEWVHGLHEFI